MMLVTFLCTCGCMRAAVRASDPVSEKTSGAAGAGLTVDLSQTPAGQRAAMFAREACPCSCARW